MQTRAVPWVKARVEYRRPTTALSIEWERRREASDGNDAVYEIWRIGIHPLNSRVESQTGMSLHRSDNANQRGWGTGTKDRVAMIIAERTVRPADRTNIVKTSRCYRALERWLVDEPEWRIKVRVGDDRWTTRFHAWSTMSSGSGDGPFPGLICQRGTTATILLSMHGRQRENKTLATYRLHGVGI